MPDNGSWLLHGRSRQRTRRSDRLCWPGLQRRSRLPGACARHGPGHVAPPGSDVGRFFRGPVEQASQTGGL